MNSPGPEPTSTLGAEAALPLPLPGLLPPRGRPALAASLRRLMPAAVPRALTSAIAVRLAFTATLTAVFATALFAAAGPTILVPRSTISFPGWEAGPLHLLMSRWLTSRTAYELGLSVVLLVLLASLGVLLGAVRRINLRTLVGVILGLHAILLLCPPLPLTDIFNYLGYFRLGGLHGINPYVHGIGMEPHDPVYRFSTWHHLRSPYGPLFTAVGYSIAHLPVSVAYWLAKLAAVGGSLAFLGLVFRCARMLGHDPRRALVFVALNPIYLIYELGGFHNDFFMLVPTMAAIALLLARRDRAAGAALMFAVAVKFTAILILPFLLVAAQPSLRRARLLTGCALAAVPLTLMSLIVFGPHLPDLADQSTLLTDWSVPNLLGWALGFGGGAPILLRAANVAVVLTVALLLRRRVAWLEAAGWATFALILSLAWLVPWYVVWLLPLAALGHSVRLRRAALGLTVFLTLAFLPIVGPFFGQLNIDLLSGGPGQASRALQAHLGG